MRFRKFYLFILFFWLNTLFSPIFTRKVDDSSCDEVLLTSNNLGVVVSWLWNGGKSLHLRNNLRFSIFRVKATDSLRNVAFETTILLEPALIKAQNQKLRDACSFKILN